MAERIVSPGVFTNERDQSFLQRGVSEIGAAVIGTTVKGPAFIPTQVNSFTDFIDTFGSYTDDSYVPFTVQEYLKNAGVCTVTRLLYKGGYKLKDGVLAIIASSGSVEYITHVLHPTNPVATDGDNSVFEKSTLVDTNSGSFSLWVSGSYTNNTAVPGFTGGYKQTGSFQLDIDSNSSKYVGNKFNYNPKSVNYPVYVQYENTNTAALFNNKADIKLRLGIINYENTKDGDKGFASTPFITSNKVAGDGFDLFRFHTLSHGTAENYEVKVAISDIKTSNEITPLGSYPTFTVELRGVNNSDIPFPTPFQSDDTDADTDDKETYRNVNLDPSSPNYIARVIGDQVRTIDENGKIKDEGDYPNVSKLVRVECSIGVQEATLDSKLLPFGFKAPFSPLPDGEESSGNVKPDLTLSSFTGGTGGTAGTYVVTPTASGTGTGLDLSVTTSNDNGKLVTGTIAVTGQINDGTDATYNNVDLSDGTGTGAQATVVVSSNAVTSVTVSAIGSGYQSGDVLKIAAGLLGGGSSEVTLTALAAGNLLVEPTLVKTVGIGSGYTANDTLTVDLGDIGTASGNLIVTLQSSEVQNLAQGLEEVKYRTSQFINNAYSGDNFYGFDFTNVHNFNYLAPVPTSGSTVALNTDFYLGDIEQDAEARHPLTNAYSGSLQAALDTGTFESKIKPSTRKFIVPFQGGFDGAKPNLPKFNGKNIAANNTFGFDCSGNSTSGTLAYRSAFAALSNTDFFDINMLVTPGILHSAHPAVTNDARILVEKRSDTFYVMDVPTIDQNIASTISNTIALDSNYTATYFPWVRIIDPSTNKGKFVPPSVLVPGALSFNDSVSAPWYAPAGLNRGGLTTAINTYEKLTQADRDELYEARINPIANFPNQGICIWGQKTLQARASALDRVNVRRLLITVKKFIASATKFLVFEQNTDATRLRFLSIANPYLESVRAQQGLSAFRVVMDDSNNTPDLIDQNILYGQIFLQPTRTAEFIVLDFNIQPTGASFPE